MIEYISIYLKKQSDKYARILDESDVVHSIKSLYKLLSSYRDREVLRTQVCNQKVFKAGGGRFVELEHCDKHFIKNTRKRGPAGKHFGYFSPRYS